MTHTQIENTHSTDITQLVGVFFTLFAYDINRLYVQNATFVKSVFFFFMVITMFPLIIGPQTALLSDLSSGIVILSLLFACLIPIHHFFDDDLADKTLEQMMLSPIPLGFMIFIKICAHWCIAGLPLVLLSPVFAFMLASHHPGLIFIVAVPASLLFVLIGMLGAVIAAGTRQGGLLLAVLVIPLYVPVVIFASIAMQAGSVGIDPNLQQVNATSALYFLYAGLALMTPIVPIICSKILKFTLR